MNIDYINKAKLLYESGNYDESLECLKLIITDDNMNTRANELLGYIIANSGDLENAHEYLLKACSDVNSSAEVNYYLGKSFIYKKQYSEAIKYINISIKKAGDYFEGLQDLGVAQASIGKFNDALLSLNKAKILNSESDAIYINLATVHKQLGNIDEALKNYDSALVINNENIYVLIQKAILLSNKYLYEDALSVLKKAYNIEPSNNDILLEIGIINMKIDNFNNALSLFEYIISKELNNGYAWLNKTSCLIKLKKYKQAIDSSETTLKNLPYSAEAYLNKGAILSYSNKCQESLFYLNKSIQLNSSDAYAYVLKGEVLNILKEYDEAIVNLKRAIEIDKYNYDAHYNLAISLFNKLDYKLGWREYEWRWLLSNMKTRKFVTCKPKWNGAKKPNKLLLWNEQGIGEQILFSSVFNKLKYYPQTIYIYIDKKLKSIYERSFPKFIFLDSMHEVKKIDFDEHCSFGDVASIFINKADDINTNYFPYLFIDNDLHQREVIRTEENDQLITCGLSWQSFGSNFGSEKSIPLNELKELFKIKNIQWINLQYLSDSETEIKLINDSIKNLKINFINDISFESNNIDKLASLITSCDIVISCSNSTAHLAGALNKDTCLILAKNRGRFWFWSEHERKCLWYPSIKIFHQTNIDNWDEPIKGVRNYLSNFKLVK